MLQKYVIKINILKLSSNKKKWIVLLTWSRECSIKFELEQRCWQTGCRGGRICNKRLICDKIKGGYVVCYIEKIKEEEEMGERRVACQVRN
jgi:hypothetical protein